MRRISAYTPLVLLLAIAFVGFGDSFLPKPWNTMSRQSREALNNIIAKAVPSWSPKTKPYQRTEDALKRETEPQP
ncbi:MAG: hypothetical protein NZ772_13440 [Cyanobacteria bacterium]|nr:hypothetical protein [Cyanobacteriota bacterium]MDW8202395.1 hypothetical protein [Cyanobacteriota bacterium SKYGB_h_bin112]